jgi:hypothetical protein
MAQLSYAEQPQAFAGMIADFGGRRSVQSMLNGEAAAEIAFGKFVVQSTPQTPGPASAGGGTPALAKLPAAAGDDFSGGGVVLQSHDYDKRLDLGAVGVLPKRIMGVMRVGKVWMRCEQAMAVTDPVFIRHTTNGALVPGDVRKDADTARAVQLYGARVVQATTAAGLVQIELDMNAYRGNRP